MMLQFRPRALPPELEILSELALDLRWTWSHAGDALWRNVDPVLWERTRSPWVILQNTPQSRLEALAADPGFRKELQQLVEERRQYMREPGRFSPACLSAGIKSVAYFSMEFGLSEAFPLYAGGLGVLAGDCLKTASDLGVPVVGVGLLYQEGYFRQMVDARGRQLEAYPYNDPASLPIQPVTDPTGAWLKVDLEFPGRIVHFRVWQAGVGRIQLYLLDSNDMLNGPGDRGITAKLYGGSSEMRLMQEVVLGIGGWRMLEALAIAPDVCHLNEGHPAFAVLERARAFAQECGLSFEEAMSATRAGNVFTTHTPVAAGFDRFAPDLMRQYFEEYSRCLRLPLAKLLALGRIDEADDREPFNMALLALRGCIRANAVSRLHGEVSRHLFAGLFPRWPEHEVPIGHITNGIHVPSWDSLWADRLWSEACGKGRWLRNLDDLPDAIQATDDEALWLLAGRKRTDLVRYARERLAWQLGQRGATAAQVAQTSQVLDPNVLTLGFARRFAEYKRPNLLLQDPERLVRLLQDPHRPVQIIVAGKAHPQDDEAKRLVQAWLAFVGRADVRAHAVFLQDYDMALAQELVQGVDVWINTPRRPWEACGTSGMKVLANGGLNLSTLDGWWAEAYTPEVGWAIGGTENGSRAADAADAQSLYAILERDVVPMFYERDEQGIPRRWTQRMRASIANLAPRFSSSRMLQEYLQQLYCPAAATFRRRSANGGALAKELTRWRARVATGWEKMHFGEVQVERRGDDWHFSAPVQLGEISPDCVRVELYADADANDQPVRQPMARGPALIGVGNGYVYTAAVPASRPSSHFTARIVPAHPDLFTPMELPLILWAC